MTIAVALDGVGYDGPQMLTTKQQQVSQGLTFASPRDIKDLSQVYKYTWPSQTNSPNYDPPGDFGPNRIIKPQTDSQFDTYIQTSYTPDGNPVYGVYLNDDSGNVHYLSGATTGPFSFQNVVVATPGGNTAFLIGKTSVLPDGTAHIIQPGDLVQNPSNVAAPVGYTGPSGPRTVVGSIKFEAQSGLALAQINTRLADINNVIQTLAKVLSTQSDMFNTSSGLVR